MYLIILEFLQWSRDMQSIPSSGNFYSFIWHQGHFRSNNNESPWSVGRMHHPGSQDVTPVSVRKLWTVQARTAEPPCSGGLWSARIPGQSDEQAQRQSRALWRSQSSVTDKVIMLLLFAFKAVIKCDRDCPAAAPIGRQRGARQHTRQGFLTGEAVGGDAWRI